MSDPVPQLNPEQRNGRQLLVLALMFLGAIPLLTLYIAKSSPVALFGCMIGYGVIASFAFRGGQIALGLLKGFSLLMGLAFTVLLMTLAIWYVRDGKPPEAVTRQPWEIIVPALFAYFAIGVLFFSKTVRTFLQFQRSDVAALLALLAFFPFASAHADSATPEPVGIDRYSALLERSPFAPSTAPVAAAPAPSFARNYYLTGLATIGGKAFATISSRDKQTRFTLLEGESHEGMTLTRVDWAPGVGKSRVTLTQAGVNGTVSFDEAAMKVAPVAVAPVATTQAQGAEPQGNDPRREGRWSERGRWRDRGDWRSPEQRQFMRERRRAWFRATHGQGNGGPEGMPNQHQRAEPINAPNAQR